MTARQRQGGGSCARDDLSAPTIVSDGPCSPQRLLPPYFKATACLWVLASFPGHTRIGCRPTYALHPGDRAAKPCSLRFVGLVSSHHKQHFSFSFTFIVIYHFPIDVELMGQWTSGPQKGDTEVFCSGFSFLSHVMILLSHT